jgi:spore coat polysaccharide biosynthesis protein SpsF (cytidylyltransferase family)
MYTAIEKTKVAEKVISKFIKKYAFYVNNCVPVNDARFMVFRKELLKNIWHEIDYYQTLYIFTSSNDYSPAFFGFDKALKQSGLNTNIIPKDFLFTIDDYELKVNYFNKKEGFTYPVIALELEQLSDMVGKLYLDKNSNNEISNILLEYALSVEFESSNNGFIM